MPTRLSSTRSDPVQCSNPDFRINPDSDPDGRLPKVDLIIEGRNVRPPVRPYVRPSTKSFFNLNEIWYIGRGR